MNPYIESLQKAYGAFIDQVERSTPSNRPYCYASGYEECDRKLTLLMTKGDLVQPFPTNVRARFRRGKDRERNLIADLSATGRLCDPPFEVVAQQQRFELKDRKGRVVIAGMMDLGLKFGRDVMIPAEIKDYNSNLSARIETFEDVLQNRWTKKAAYQLPCYMFGANQPLGMLILTTPDIPKFIPVELNDLVANLTEEFMQKGERALDHKIAGTLPGYFDDYSECQRCQFLGIACDPPIKTEGTRIFTDPEIEEKLLRYLEIEAVGEEYESLDKWVKKEFRGVETGLAGRALIQGRWQQYTSYPFDDESKATIESLKAKCKKIDPKGAFRVTVTKV
jgi:hypothetical protein